MSLKQESQRALVCSSRRRLKVGSAVVLNTDRVQKYATMQLIADQKFDLNSTLPEEYIEKVFNFESTITSVDQSTMGIYSNDFEIYASENRKVGVECSNNTNDTISYDRRVWFRDISGSNLNDREGDDPVSCYCVGFATSRYAEAILAMEEEQAFRSLLAQLDKTFALLTARHMSADPSQFTGKMPPSPSSGLLIFRHTFI